MGALPPQAASRVSHSPAARAARPHVTLLAPFTGRHLGRPWKKLEKRRAKEAKEGAPLASSRHEREFVPGLLKLFLATLRRAEALGPEEAGVRSLARLLERLLELFTDLMAQLPTRRFFHAVLLDSHLLVHASLSPFGKREAGTHPAAITTRTPACDRR